MHRRLITLLFGVGCLALSATAMAQDPDLAAAKTAFKSGQQLMKDGQYAAAISEFRKAHEITKDDLVMGQIALAYEKAQDYEAALEALTKYRAALPEADRAAVDEMAGRYRSAVEAGKSRPLQVAGDKATVPGHAAADAETYDDAMADEVEEVDVDGPERFWTWIAAGTAGALGLGALVIGLNAQSKFDDLEAVCAPTKPGDAGCDASEIDSVETRAAVTDVFLGLAVGAAIAAGVLYFVEGAPGAGGEAESEEEDEELGARLQLTPVFGPHQWGVGAVVTY